MNQTLGALTGFVSWTLLLLVLMEQPGPSQRGNAATRKPSGQAITRKRRAPSSARLVESCRD